MNSNTEYKGTGYSIADYNRKQKIAINNGSLVGRYVYFKIGKKKAAKLSSKGYLTPGKLYKVLTFVGSGLYTIETDAMWGGKGSIANLDGSPSAHLDTLTHFRVKRA